MLVLNFLRNLPKEGSIMEKRNDLYDFNILKELEQDFGRKILEDRVRMIISEVNLVLELGCIDAEIYYENDVVNINLLFEDRDEEYILTPRCQLLAKKGKKHSKFFMGAFQMIINLMFLVNPAMKKGVKEIIMEQ